MRSFYFGFFCLLITNMSVASEKWLCLSKERVNYDFSIASHESVQHCADLNTLKKNGNTIVYQAKVIREYYEGRNYGDDPLWHRVGSPGVEYYTYEKDCENMISRENSNDWKPITRPRSGVLFYPDNLLCPTQIRWKRQDGQ